MPLNWKKKKLDEMTFVEFEIEGGIVSPDELRDIVDSAPEVDNTKGVCISGRGPVWLFSALTEKYHPTKFVGTFEPRKNACVVTSRHAKGYDIGETIPLD